MAKETESSIFNWLFGNSYCCGDRGKNKGQYHQKVSESDDTKNWLSLDSSRSTEREPSIQYPHLEDFPNVSSSDRYETDYGSIFKLLGATGSSESEEAIEIKPITA